MKIELIEKATEGLDEFISRETDTLPFASEKGFKGINIEEKNFHTLSLFADNKKIIAIDGGNSNIIKGANFSLDFIRIVSVVYKDKKRVDIKKKEFFCFVSAQNTDNKIYYKINLIGDKLEMFFKDYTNWFRERF